MCTYYERPLSSLSLDNFEFGKSPNIRTQNNVNRSNFSMKLMAVTPHDWTNQLGKKLHIHFLLVFFFCPAGTNSHNQTIRADLLGKCCGYTHTSQWFSRNHTGKRRPNTPSEESLILNTKGMKPIHTRTPSFQWLFFFSLYSSDVDFCSTYKTLSHTHTPNTHKHSKASFFAFAFV